MSDGRDRIVSGVSGSGNKVHRLQNPEVEKTWNVTNTERAAKNRIEEGKSTAKDEHHGEPFYKNDQKKDADKGKSKKLLRRLHDLAIRAYRKVKHAVEWAIGRGRIPAMPIVNRTDFSRSVRDLSGKDKLSVDKVTQERAQDKEKGRNWKELFYHGFARRLLGKDAYMYAVQQSEKQDVLKQRKNAQESEKTGQAQKDENGKEGKDPAKRAKVRASQEKPEQFSSRDTQEQGRQSKAEISQKELEEMKGKFNSLYKVITDDLEDRFLNAREAKEAYLRHYAEQLQEKLTKLNHGEMVQVLAVRENGKLKIHINDEPEQYGGYPLFMGCSRIRVEIDGHLNITSAEAFVPTKQDDGGKFIGRKIDISDTLGAYILSDLEKNFREDYNPGTESYTFASRKEFEHTVRDAALQGQNEFTIDNITYMLSVKDNQMQVNQAAVDKAFSITMEDGAGEVEAAREKYEAKSEQLQEVEKKLEDAKNGYQELVEKYRQKQDTYKQAEAKAIAAKQKHRDATQKLNKIQKQLSEKYPGAEKMDELKTQEQKAIGARNTAFKESKNANIEKNTAQAELDKTDKEMKQVWEQIGVLEHEAAPLRDACREAKEQYDSVSLAQKDVFGEIYQAHTKSVVESRASSIRVFEEILPECKNDIGRNFGLEDLKRVMEETLRASVEEALNDQAKSGQETEFIDEERMTGPESQENIAELE